MLKSPELKPEKSELSELAITNAVQVELMKRSRMRGVDWIKKNSPEFRNLFKENQEQFLKLYKEDPSELCALLEMVLGRKN